MSKLRMMPSLGGWLAIANCAAWVLLIGLINTYHDVFPDCLEIPLGICVIALSLPIAFPFMLPDLDQYHGPTYAEQVMVAIVIGVNSFLWGYGIEFLLHKARRFFRPRQPLIPPSD